MRGAVESVSVAPFATVDLDRRLDQLTGSGSGGESADSSAQNGTEGHDRQMEFCVQERYSFVLIEKLKEIRSNLVKRFDGYTEPEFVL